MQNEAPDRRTKGYMLMRAIMDYGMGIIILSIGVFFFFAPKFGVQLMIADVNRYLMAGLFVLYGGFRVYRGFKKNYFRE